VVESSDLLVVDQRDLEAARRPAHLPERPLGSSAQLATSDGEVTPGGSAQRHPWCAPRLRHSGATARR
jgi:hypothetical protein